jgi:hypothetical protein
VQKSDINVKLKVELKTEDVGAEKSAVKNGEGEAYGFCNNRFVYVALAETAAADNRFSQSDTRPLILIPRVCTVEPVSVSCSQLTSLARKFQGHSKLLSRASKSWLRADAR